MWRLVMLGLMLSGPAMAESYRDIQDRKPELFHAETGYRIGRQRAPTPEDIPGPALAVDAVQSRALIEAGGLALDVFGAAQSRFDELDGTWLVREERHSLPGAVWLPEVGRGTLSETMQRYLAENLSALTEGDMARPIVVFCVADCWMSWNAAQRIVAMGHAHVYWFRLGTDGWLDEGWELAPVDPVPVTVD